MMMMIKIKTAINISRWRIWIPNSRILHLCDHLGVSDWINAYNYGVLLMQIFGGLISKCASDTLKCIHFCSVLLSKTKSHKAKTCEPSSWWWQVRSPLTVNRSSSLWSHQRWCYQKMSFVCKMSAFLSAVCALQKPNRHLDPVHMWMCRQGWLWLCERVMSLKVVKWGKKLTFFFFCFDKVIWWLKYYCKYRCN